MSPSPPKPIDRRQFATGVLAAGLARSAPAQPDSPQPEHFLLPQNAWIPNNQSLPVLLYRSALRPGQHASSDALASAMESAFQANGWPAQWRNGIYTFHHFHSTAHEVLGIAAGEVRVVLGGPLPSTPGAQGGRELTLRAGDVALLPAGTGHCSLHSSTDLLVIGAYPPDQHWDICRTALSPEQLDRMHHLPFPVSDPVLGHSGPLPSLWKPA